MFLYEVRRLVCCYEHVDSITFIACGSIVNPAMQPDLQDFKPELSQIRLGKLSSQASFVQYEHRIESGETGYEWSVVATKTGSYCMLVNNGVALERV